MDELMFEPITGEEYREYTFPNGQKLLFTNVTAICVRPSGSHRLQTLDGKKFIVQPGWLCIEVKAENWSK